MVRLLIYLCHVVVNLVICCGPVDVFWVIGLLESCRGPDIRLRFALRTPAFKVQFKVFCSRLPEDCRDFA